MTPGAATPRRVGGLLLVLALGCALPALALPDAALADSMTFRLKLRILGPLGIFAPSSSELINPYYRPLFVLLQGGVDALTGNADWGLRLLALLCHAFAGAMLFRLARTLSLSEPVARVGVLLFLVAPGNVFTAAWPVVAYWTLAAGLAFGVAANAIRYVSSGRPWLLVVALVVQAASLLVSQTGYHFVAFGAWLWLHAPGQPAPGARRRALSTWIGLSALALLHFALLESAARGLAPESTLGRAASTVAGIWSYWQGSLGGDPLFGSAGAAIAFLLLILLGSVRSPRPVRFLIGFAVLAPLPFAAFGVSERYAYFGAGPLCLWAAWSFLQGWPANLPAGGVLGRIAAAALLVVLTFQAVGRLEDVREASRQTGAYVADLKTLHEELPDLSRTAFVNLPPLLKWSLNDLWQVDREEDLMLVSAPTGIGPRNLSAFTTRTHYFGPAELRSQGFEVVLHCDGGRIVRRSPEHPLGDRTALPTPWFFAESFEAVTRSKEPARGSREDQELRDRIAARVAELGDPRSLALLEQSPEELTSPLPTGPAEFELHMDPEAAAGARFPGELRVRSNLPRAGLLVVITWFGAEDPVHRIGGDTGRFCSSFEARVDGAPVTIVPVDYHCVGVVVPAGSHQIVVRPRGAAGT